MTAPITTVDCRGMRCPAPILTLSKATRKADAGAQLEVLADDGDFPADLEAWCQSTGATLSKIDNQDGFFRAQIRLKGEAAAAAAAASSSAPSSAVEMVEIDCKGMCCPAPILAVAKAARKNKGQVVLRVQADDGDFPVDLKAWARSTGSELFSVEEEDGVYTALVGLHGAKLPSAGGGTASELEDTPTVSEAPVDLDLRGTPPAEALLKIGGHSMAHAQFSFAIAADDALRQQLVAWSAALTRNLELTPRGDHFVGRLGPAGSFVAPVSVQRAPAPEPTPAPPATAAPVPVQVVEHVAPAVPTENKCTLLVLRNDFESLMAALMVANASAAQGMDVEVFFSFWGVNVLRGEAPRQVETTELEKPGFLKSMMKMMMPAGPDRQQMSKMNFGGAGVGMMKYFMKQQNILGIRELMEQAVEMDVKFVVCTMSMGIMGISKADLMDLPNLEFGGVTAFSSSARISASSMVF